MIWIRPWLALMLPVILAGCVTPYTGPTYSARTGEEVASENGRLTATIKPGTRPALDTDEAGWRMTYDKAEASFRTSGRLITDPKLNRYIKELVCEISGPYCKDIRVYVIRAPFFNANMGPNGAMQVWSGLLLRVRNEAQLVAVLGHEIGHYLRQHGLQRMRNAVDTTNALAFFQLAAAGAGVGIVGNLGTIVALAQMTAYSRDQEREADRFGHQILVDHGYDPREASKVWAQLMAEQNAAKDDKAESKTAFLSTHPLPAERYETLTLMAEEDGADETLTKIGTDRYNEVVLPHRRQFLQDELNLRRFDRFDALLEMLIEDGYKRAELYFFRGEIYRLRGQESDDERALEFYKTALEKGEPPVEIHRSLGQLYRKRGEGKKAKEAFSRYLEVRPDAEDADIIRYMIGTL